MGRLNAGFVQTIRQPGRYGDGRGSYGLALIVRPRADGGVRKSWAQRIRINGRSTNIGLGPFPVVLLAEARRKALKNRRAVEQGKDPRGGRTPSFAEVAEKVIELHRQGWKPGASTEGKWRSSLKYALPVIGHKPISEVTSGDVLRVLTPIWADKPAVARQLRQRIAAIMRWAIAEGHRDNNPAGEALTGALPKQNSVHQHHRALPHAQVGGALDKIRRSAAYPTARLAVEFQAVTAVRPSEARMARWDEIDRDRSTWTIPAERMKAKREHRVPLSTRALKVLHAAREHSNGSGLVFPNRTGRPLGHAAISDVLKNADIDAVPHGFRSSFRIWVEECTDTPRSVAEAALAHVNRNQVEAAYLRSDLFDRRRQLMEEWSEYLRI